ncbi:MAG: M48 family metallopeptidase [Rhodoferax sp.]|uniref:M48 family metallopeptidase n=1 Tax=Rhodoferax sp. TaxID=50421 RepID=UPI002615B7A2|nr:M48 family metallopeptidase [Rhodoferax sp.]MDD5333465.1 M48 family metallopeptidase [Rhodoferax sp.]
MDFFAKQNHARQHTWRLVLLLLLAVMAVITVTDLLVTVGVTLVLEDDNLPWLFHPLLVGATIVAIIVCALWREYQLRGGGDAVAKIVGARLLPRHAENMEERRFLNVVDEMAIASGVAVPSVWVMDAEKSINALAAGYSPNQAVIVVTQGMLTQLNRDELQGVIGHEFSHILNGDMRLNVRLIGVLAGLAAIGTTAKGVIVLLLAIPAALLGAMSFFVSKIQDGFDKRLQGWKAVIWLPVFFIVGSPLLLLMAGLLYVGAMGTMLGGKTVLVLAGLIIVVGSIGVLFGRLIRAAVSRQREFLADAASVQFTRNPDGLISALEKIRGGEGSLVSNALAGELSHMFFSQAIKSALLKDWFATHPSIDERLASITGHGPEVPAKPRVGVTPEEGQAWSVPQAAVANFSVTPLHVEQATRMLDAMPQALRQALNSAQGARAAVYALLLSSDAKLRATQTSAFGATGDGAMTPTLDELAKSLQELGPAGRLPVLALATPALRQMSPSERKALLSAVDQCAKADQEVTLAEFVVVTILKRQLSGKASGGKRVRQGNLNTVKAEVLLLLVTLARAGDADPAAQKAAFARGATRIGFEPGMPPSAPFAADAMSAALDRLRQLTPVMKQDLISACVEAALVDGKLLLAEVELLRTIGMAIDCPLPPSVTPA